MVHLQAEAGAGLNFNALNFETYAVFLRGVSTPGSVRGKGQLVGLVASRLETGEYMPYIFCLCPISHQQCIRRIYYDEVVNAHNAHQASVSQDGTLARVV